MVMVVIRQEGAIEGEDIIVAVVSFCESRAKQGRMPWDFRGSIISTLKLTVSCFLASMFERTFARTN